jgi:hypothetical protein
MILITKKILWILSWIINQINIIIDVHTCMLIAIKHYFACNERDFRWLFLDDKFNPHIDVNQFSCRVVVS